MNSDYKRFLHFLGEVEYSVEKQRPLPQDEPTEYEIALIEFMTDLFGDTFEADFAQLVGSGKLDAYLDFAYDLEGEAVNPEVFESHFYETFGPMWLNNLETDLHDYLDELWGHSREFAQDEAESQDTEVEEPEEEPADESEFWGFMIPFAAAGYAIGFVESIIIPELVKELRHGIDTLMDKTAVKEYLIENMPENVLIRAAPYIDGLSAAVVNRIRNVGRILRWGNLGSTEIIWITARDDKVCPRCMALDGKVFKINTLTERINTFSSAQSNEEAINALPWPGAKGDNYVLPDGSEIPMTSPADVLSQVGIGVPPLHPLCRCFVELAT